MIGTIIPLVFMMGQLTADAKLWNDVERGTEEPTTIRYRSEYPYHSVDGEALLIHIANSTGGGRWRRIARGAPKEAIAEMSFLDDDDSYRGDYGEDEEYRDEEEDYGDVKDDEYTDVMNVFDLREFRRRYIKKHNMLIPLLLAYKLKFSALLPLLVGSMVMLVSATILAGFFFALFSAALGLRAKYHH